MQKVLVGLSRARSHTGLERHERLGIRTAAVLGRGSAEPEEERSELGEVDVRLRNRLELHGEHAGYAERVRRVEAEEASH